MVAEFQVRLVLGIQSARCLLVADTNSGTMLCAACTGCQAVVAFKAPADSGSRKEPLALRRRGQLVDLWSAGILCGQQICTAFGTGQVQNPQAEADMEILELWLYL